MTVEIKCNSKESAAIKELRKRMKGVLETELYEDDYFLRRFLIVRDFNIDKTEAMLREHIEWREIQDLKNILKFKKPEVIEKYIHLHRIGHDKEGNIIRYCHVGNMDLIGLNRSVKFEDMIKLAIFEAEKDTLELKEQSKKYGRNIDQCLMIYNLENLTFAQATDQKCLYTTIYFMNVIQKHYPERVKKVFIINTSLYFTFVYNMLKPFASKSYLEKIHISSDDSYQEELFKLVDYDELPAFLGGTRTDPDGNPFCRTFIKCGEPIPEAYYLQKRKKSIAKTPGVVKVSLSRASFHEVYLEVKEPDSYLEWEFETKCRDIGFGLFHQTIVDGEETNEQIIPIQRIDTEISTETGMLKCDKVGSYVLIFDNTYSWIRAKEIFYRIKVLTSEEHKAQMTLISSV